MSKVPWARVRPILEEVLDLPPEERTGRARELCGEDTKLASEVLRLAELEDRPTKAEQAELLEGTAFRRLFGGDISPGPGMELGDYRIQREIGAGGMGRVFEATQKNPERSVALKVLAPGMATERHMARFKDEVQFLARLQHPGIAQVHGAGLWKDTQGNAWPYFAMEYVEGAQTLVERAHSIRVDGASSGAGPVLKPTLRLFAEVCEAVHYGHTQGVLHRDLKPGNILVSSQGRAKVIDYGVARAMDLDQGSELTQTGEIVGTMRYMSPEQVRGQELGVASDVYSLGVVFYECLCGRSPYGGSQVDIPALAMAILEAQPVRPGLLEPELKGDLEWVLLKALEKDPNRRYPSAAALAEDLGRYLEHKPLLAGPPSTTYRLRKFVVRNRIAVTAALVLAAGLGAGLVVSLKMYLKAQDERLLRIQEEAGRIAARESLLTSIQSLTPGIGTSVRVENLLDSASEDGAQTFDGDRITEIKFRSAISKSFSRLGLYQRAMEEAQRALQLAEGTLSPADMIRIELNVIVAQALTGLGDYKAAHSVAQRMFEQTRASAGDGARPTATARAYLGKTLMNVAGDLDEAEDQLRTAITVLGAELGQDAPSVLQVEQDLASCLNRLGYGEASLELYASIRERMSRTLGPSSPEVVWCGLGEAETLAGSGQAEQALLLTQKVLREASKDLKEDHPLYLYLSAAVASYTLMSGRHEQAAQLLEACLEPMERVLGATHLETLKVQGMLGKALELGGDLLGAVEAYRQAHEDARSAVGAQSPRLLPFSVDLGRALFQTGSSQEGLEVMEDAVALGVELFGESHPENMYLQIELGEKYGKAQDFEGALSKALLVEGILQAQDEPDRSILASVQLLKGKCLFVMGQTDEAAQVLLKTHKAHLELYGPEDKKTIEAARFLGYTQR